MAGARFCISSVVALVLLCSSFTTLTEATALYDYYDDSSSESSVNMSAVCGLVPSGELVADPNNCGYYFLCSNGAATIEYCSSGYYFAKNSQGCLPQSEVSCTADSSSATPCSGITVGTWAAMAGNCNGYYYCSNSGPEAGYCPSGENFNPTAQACQNPTTYQCTNSGTGDSIADVNLCDFIQDGIYFGSPTSCQGWNLCQNGALTSGNCPTGYNYNVQQGGCIASNATTCPQLSNDPSLTQDPYYGGACNSTSNLTIAATTCENYYVCNGLNYTLTICPNDLYYDTVSGSCVSRLNARNNCDRCEGSSLTFVNTYSASNCTGYAYCQNGVATSTGTCPSGSYFNEISAACVVGADPNFGCCNPAYYNSTSSSNSTTTTTLAPS